VKNEKQLDPKELFIKKILKSDDYLEQFLKDCIRMFPFRDCTIFRQVKLFAIIKSPVTAVSNNITIF